LALVTFPAAGIIFTSPLHYNLSSTAYGGMFVPQAILAISASLLGASLTGRWGIKRIYLLGLVANLISMALLVLSQFVMVHHALVYSILLCATASLGIGFGLTVPSLNTLAAAFSRRRSTGPYSISMRSWGRDRSRAHPGVHLRRPEDLVGPAGAGGRTAAGAAAV